MQASAFSKPAPPKVANSTLIAIGDEASVRRISSCSKLFDGLVERRCAIKTQDPILLYPFYDTLSSSWNVEASFANYEPSAHLFRFHTSRLAHSLFPENFPRPVAVRFSLEQNGETVNGCALLYSEYVPDNGGVLQYTGSQRLEFDKKISPNSKFPELYWKLVEEQEKEMLFHATEACPPFASCLSRIGESGLKLAPPVWNYHLRGGKPVFFEVMGLDFEKMAAYIGKLPESRRKTAAIRILATCIAIGLRSIAEESEKEFWKPVLEIPFAEFCRRMIGFAQEGGGRATLFSELANAGYHLESFARISEPFGAILRRE